MSDSTSAIEISAQLVSLTDEARAALGDRSTIPIIQLPTGRSCWRKPSMTYVERERRALIVTLPLQRLSITFA